MRRLIKFSILNLNKFGQTNVLCCRQVQGYTTTTKLNDRETAAVLM